MSFSTVAHNNTATIATVSAPARQLEASSVPSSEGEDEYEEEVNGGAAQGAGAGAEEGAATEATTGGVGAQEPSSDATTHQLDDIVVRIAAHYANTQMAINGAPNNDSCGAGSPLGADSAPIAPSEAGAPHGTVAPGSQGATPRDQGDAQEDATGAQGDAQGDATGDQGAAQEDATGVQGAYQPRAQPTMTTTATLPPTATTSSSLPHPPRTSLPSLLVFNRDRSSWDWRSPGKNWKMRRRRRRWWICKIKEADLEKKRKTIQVKEEKKDEEEVEEPQAMKSRLSPGLLTSAQATTARSSPAPSASSSAVPPASQSTTGAVVQAATPPMPMPTVQELTNDLCYGHQIVFHPVSLPVHLYIAGRLSQREAMILANVRPVLADDKDYERVNEELGYNCKALFNTRFNA